MVKYVFMTIAVVGLVAFAGCTPSRENGGGSGAKAEDSRGQPMQQEITSPEGVPRVDPEEIYDKVQSGETLLVCAYDDARFANSRLDGAISQSQLAEKLKAGDKTAEIVFYCA